MTCVNDSPGTPPVPWWKVGLRWLLLLACFAAAMGLLGLCMAPIEKQAKKDRAVRLAKQRVLMQEATTNPTEGKWYPMEGGGQRARVSGGWMVRTSGGGCEGPKTTFAPDSAKGAHDGGR